MLLLACHLWGDRLQLTGKENLLPCVVFHLLTIFQLQFQLNNNLVPERKAKNPSHRQKSVSVSCKTKG